MGRQSEKRHTLPLSGVAADAPADLPAELNKLVEKRTGGDRRAKLRRGGPPRRSLKDAVEKASEKPAARDSERRRKERRKTSDRRATRRRS